MTLSACLGIVAPYYNLALVIIVVFLFIRLFKTKNEKLNKPWLFLFLAVLIYILEEVLTVLRAAGLPSLPRVFNGIFEMCMLSLFIYMLLLQKEAIKKTKGK
jgi:hypothetical protein